MKYLEYYKTFEKKSSEEILKKILTFCKDEYIAKKAIELNPKLSVWIVNNFIKDFIKNDPEDDNEASDYFKTGNNTNMKKNVFESWNRTYGNIFQSIIDWTKSPDISDSDRKNLKNMSLEEAYDKSEKWHNSLIAGGVIEDEHGTILMNFPDGFYWIDLEKSYDRDEADAMGHCGNTNKGDTLYSLRDRNKSPHVTAAIDTEKGIVYQMKGRNNKKPIDKYHKYIVDLLMSDELKTGVKLLGFGSEYDRENDFNPSDDLTPELLNKLKEKRPDIDKAVFTDEDIDDMFERYIDYSYIDDQDYGFRLVSWLTEVTDFDTMVSNINNNDELFNILCDEYPEKIKEYSDIDYIIKNNIDINHIILNYVSDFVHSEKIANKYNIELKTNTEYNKWGEIFKYIDYDGIFDIMKDYDIYEKFLEYYKEKHGLNILKDELSDTVHYKPYLMINYKYVLDFFFDDNDERAMEQLTDLFDYVDGENYCKEVSDIWDLNSCSSDLSGKLTREEKEKELKDNDYYEYIGDY